MNFKIASAPCCWGVEDAKNPDNPKWGKVLDEASKAGYQGIELGPFGYLPQDVDILQEALEQRNLKIVAGTLYDNLVAEENLDKIIEKTRITCSLISKLPKADRIEGQRYRAPYLVVIDEVNAIRSPFAGRPDQAPRLSKEKWNQMMEHIRIVSRIAQDEYGIRAVLHPHAGGYIEYDDEIVKFLDAFSAEEIGLCLDTGHLYYARMDPVAWLEKYADRLDYVHFKDIDQKVYEDVIRREIGFFEACRESVMCPIGKGIIDYEAIYKKLVEINYKGWITIEQERDPKESEGSFADVRESREYLTRAGY